MRSPKRSGSRFGGLRPVLGLTAVSVAFSLTLGLGAIPNLTRNRAATDSYDQTLEQLRVHIRAMELEQQALLAELNLRTVRIEADLAEVEGFRTSLIGADSHRSVLTDELVELRREFDARFEAELKAHNAASPTLVRRALREEVLRPVFQVTGEDAVGSAVLIHKSDDQVHPHYLALSCWHVVRDILEERERLDDPFAETFDALFDLDGEIVNLEARLLEFDEALDLALLRLDTEWDLTPVAKLAPLKRSEEIEVFSSVYTVGCPLGTVAQATRGEITHRKWKLGGQNFWMVSSPAYFGNSGGGVFLEESRELVGLFAKIYTHGSYRPQVITHMGLVIPLPVLHSWLESVGFAHILP